MAKGNEHSVQSSFLRGVQAGRKEVQGGDYHDAVIGIAVILLCCFAGLYLAVRVLRWLLR